MQLGRGTTLLGALRALLAQPSHKVVHGAAGALPELMQLGEQHAASRAHMSCWCGQDCDALCMCRHARRPPASCTPHHRLRPAGVRLGGQLEDPMHAAALLWPDAAAEDADRLSLKRIHGSVAKGFKARVPSLCRSGVTDTCRAALLALACMAPLQQMLAQRGMLEVRGAGRRRRQRGDGLAARTF